MVVIGRCVVVGMTCGDMVLGVIYGDMVVDDCLRLISVAIHGGDNRSLQKKGQCKKDRRDAAVCSHGHGRHHRTKTG